MAVMEADRSVKPGYENYHLIEVPFWNRRLKTPAATGL